MGSNQSLMILLTGYYVGMTAFPMVSQILFDSIGYSLSMGLMSIFHVIHLLAGVMFYEQPKKTKGWIIVI